MSHLRHSHKGQLSFICYKPKISIPLKGLVLLCYHKKIDAHVPIATKNKNITIATLDRVDPTSYVTIGLCAP